MTERAFVGLGSNLGDRLAALQFAVRRIAALDGCSLIHLSTIYETQPWGRSEQPPFLNAVLEIQTSLAPAVLLAEMLALESEFGRVRERRWDARTLDIDVLAVGSRRTTTEACLIPHPRLTERRFVLHPWAEIAPEFVVPELGEVRELKKQCPDPLSVEPFCCLWNLSGELRSG